MGKPLWVWLEQFKVAMLCGGRVGSISAAAVEWRQVAGAIPAAGLKVWWQAPGEENTAEVPSTSHYPASEKGQHRARPHSPLTGGGE